MLSNKTGKGKHDGGVDGEKRRRKETRVTALRIYLNIIDAYLRRRSNGKKDFFLRLSYILLMCVEEK